MHESLFTQAALPDYRVICQLPMRPFSLGHELFLIRRNNPLICLTPEDFNQLPAVDQHRAILNAADTCSQSWRELHFVPRTLLQRIRMEIVCAKWDFALRNENFPLQIAEFRNYYAAGKSDFPGDIPANSEGETRYIGAPEMLRLYRFVCHTLPASEIAHYGDSAWDFPYALARMHHSASLENDGLWSIYNWGNKVHDDFVAEREANSEFAKRGITIIPHETSAAPETAKGGSECPG